MRNDAIFEAYFIRSACKGNHFVKFSWNKRKAEVNNRKHGVTFEEASTVFFDFFSITIPDPLHHDVEERFITIGTSEEQRLLVVVHTDEGDKIRLISARQATTHERKKYEENHGFQ